MLQKSLLCLLVASSAFAQITGATFGTVVRLGGTPSDIVLDESRSLLYLVRQSTNRVDVYDYAHDVVTMSFPVSTTPVAAAMSMDNNWLYVTSNGASSLSVIDLTRRVVDRTVSLPAKPEGVEVGNDGRVLITTEGTGDTNGIKSLLIFDSRSAGAEVTDVAFPPAPPTPTGLPTVSQTRPITTFRGKLQRTPDGAFIIGLSTVNNNTSTVLFVYETASGTILRSRTVTGQSTVLSVSPDGARFMAGIALYDVATLANIATQSTANVPFPLASTGTATFNLLQNQGGSTFSPDGQLLYSAFNVAPFSQPATRPQASTLLVSNPRNLAVNLGIKMPESIVAKMVMTADGANAWGLSESGVIHLPLSTLHDQPILQPESTTVFLAVDACNRGVATASLKIANLGKGKLTFSVPDTTAALVAQATSGVAPASVTFTLEPGRTTVTRQYGTNLYSGTATNTGTALSVNLTSPDAINIPNTIKVYMNVRQTDQRGVVYPVATSPTVSENLNDIVIDNARSRAYITNPGYNRLEVFDLEKQTFLDSIEVGQLPHQMALGGDGSTLYVANTGGESISIIDLDAGAVVSTVDFPSIPRSGSTTPVTPQALAWTTYGLQVVMSNGSQWKAVNNTLTVRQSENVVPTTLNTTTATGPVRMMAAPGGKSMITLAANGTAYLYDGMTDLYSVFNRPYTTQNNVTGYYGPLASGPEGSYFLMNGFILNSSLATVGGSESPTLSAGVLSTNRNVAAVGALDANTFLRLTTPVKQNITSTPTSDPRPQLELLDLRNNSVQVVGALAENPQQSLFGNTRLNVAPRQIAVDSKGNAYILTLSGLTVVPLTASGASRPQIASGNTAIWNPDENAAILRPGSFFQLSGQSLSVAQVNATRFDSKVLGGSCVTFSDVPATLLQTSAGQIVGQVPATLSAGPYILQVRSLATGQMSDPVTVTIQRPR